MVTIAGHPAKKVEIARDIDDIFRGEGLQVNVVELPRSTAIEGVRPIAIDISVYTNAKHVNRALREQIVHARWQIASQASGWNLLSPVFMETHFHRNVVVISGKAID